MTPKGSENHCQRELGTRLAAALERIAVLERMEHEFHNIDDVVRINELEERLELWAITSNGERIRVRSDGIACRDETIKLLDQQIDRNNKRIDAALWKIKQMETELLDHAEDWALSGIAPSSEMGQRLAAHYRERAKDREDANKWREHVAACEARLNGDMPMT